jgi:hypothetical protein
VSAVEMPVVIGDAEANVDRRKVIVVSFMVKWC